VGVSGVLFFYRHATRKIAMSPPGHGLASRSFQLSRRVRGPGGRSTRAETGVVIFRSDDESVHRRGRVALRRRPPLGELWNEHGTGKDNRSQRIPAFPSSTLDRSMVTSLVIWHPPLCTSS
jgi:hypothetical protein